MPCCQVVIKTIVSKVLFKIDVCCLLSKIMQLRLEHMNLRNSHWVILRYLAIPRLGAPLSSPPLEKAL